VGIKVGCLTKSYGALISDSESKLSEPKMQTPTKVIADSLNMHYEGMSLAEIRRNFIQQDGNYVLLKHFNSEFSIYSHLRPKEVLVSKGQFVEKVDIIGYSGNTGWSIKPHLHFMVFKFLKPKPAKDLESLEIRWKK
jgi:murein DD-endopeptidase MepM/ murein hydrolase activator NlpD